MRDHGTLVKYVADRCRCEACSEAGRTYSRNRSRAMQRPDEKWEPFVDAAPAREYLRDLQKYGIGPVTVAALSGVSHGSITRILYGDRSAGRPPSRRIRPETERRILGIRYLNADGWQQIPSKATWELIDDLASRGFTKTWIAQQLVGPQALNLQFSHNRVRATTARRVEALHQSLQGKTGPGRRSRWDAA